MKGRGWGGGAEKHQLPTHFLHGNTYSSGATQVAQWMRGWWGHNKEVVSGDKSED